MKHVDPISSPEEVQNAGQWEKGYNASIKEQS
jgi:hypothetical protein